jgi:hypothetical protein
MSTSDTTAISSLAAPQLVLPPFPDPVPGIIPFGTNTVFAGAPGVGKTAMLADWIQRWRTGRTIWGHPTNPATGYYYLAADRQWSSHQKWFDLVGYSDIQHYSLADQLAFDLEAITRPGDALKLFASALASLAPIPGSHVFVDPVSPIFIAGSPNDSRAVARTLLEFSQWCQRLQINITVAAHFGKQKGDSKDRYTRPQDRIAGSGAFSGFSDTQVYLVDPMPAEGIPYHTLGWNPRHLPPAEFQCVRGPNGLFVPYDPMQEDTIAAHVLDAMQPPGESSVLNDIIDTCKVRHGYHRMQVRRALDRLIKEGRVVKLGRGKYTRRTIH